MKEKTLIQFEGAADLEAYLKSHGYPEVFRRYKDGVILTNEDQNSVLIKEGENPAHYEVAFSGCLEDLDLKMPDEKNSIAPLYLESYGSGGLFWYQMNEIVAVRTDCGESLKLLMEIGQFESEFLD